MIHEFSELTRDYQPPPYSCTCGRFSGTFAEVQAHVEQLGRMQAVAARTTVISCDQGTRGCNGRGEKHWCESPPTPTPIVTRDLATSLENYYRSSGALTPDHPLARCVRTLETIATALQGIAANSAVIAEKVSALDDRLAGWSANGGGYLDVQVSTP